MNNFTQNFFLKSKRNRFDFFKALGIMLLLLTGSNSFGQSGIIGADFSTSWTNSSGILQMSASAGTSRIIIRTPSVNTGNKYFRIVRNATVEMSPSASCIGGQDSDVSASNGTAITAANTGQCSNGAWYINVTNTAWRYVFKTPSNDATSFYWWAIQGNEQSVSSVGQNAVIAASATTITANLSGSLSTGQTVYLRYSTDNFATSTVVAMTGSVSTYTGDIPAGANVAGNTVRYYVFTGPSTGVATDGSNADLYTFNLNNNSGSNYSYVVNAFGDAFNRATLNPGNNPSYTYTSTLATGATATISGNSFLNIATGTTNGVSYVTAPTTSYGDSFNSTLSSNASALITWTFNMRWNRANTSNPAIPTSGSYGQAVILGGTSATLTTGNGYAVVYGSSGTPDPIRLVRYTAGITGTLNNICSSGVSDLSATNNYVSVRVTYSPSTNTWSLYVRDDGTTAWADPLTGVTVQKGTSTVDNTYTGSSLPAMGYVWSHAASGTDSGQFDNFRCNIAAAVAPTISSFVASPGSGTSGYVGSTVTVTGTGFTGVSVVKVGGSGGTTVTGTVVNDTTITFPAPAVSGAIYVQNTAGNATSGSSYTNLGYITKQTGTWQTAATWLGSAVPPSATTTPITIAHNVTGTTGTINVGSLTVNSTITLSTTAGSVLNVNTASTNSGIITNSGTFTTAVTYTNSGTFTVASGGTFQLNSGGFFTGTAISYNATNSTLAFNTNSLYDVSDSHAYWSSTNGPVSLSLINAGGGVRLLTGTVRTVSNVSLSAQLDLQSAGALTVNGTFTVNSGGYVSSNPPTYGSSSTLTYNSVTGYGVNLEWSANATTAGAGTPQNVTLTTSSVNMPNGARSLAGNLSIGSGSTLTLNATSGADLNIGGNWTSTGATFTHNSRAVQFRGASIQSITGTTTFAYLTINNAAGVTLASSVTVANQLDLQSGIVTLGTNNLTISSGASVTNATTTKYVATTGTGQLFMNVGNSNVTFQIGNSAYNPITFNNSGTADTFGVRVVDGTLTTAQDNTKTISRRWLVSETTAGGSNLSVVAQYNTGEWNANFVAGTNPFIGFYNGTVWAQASATAAGSNPFTFASNTNLSPASLNGTQYFALGKDNAFISVASNLVITAITPTSPTAGSGFSVTVRSQDPYGLFANVTANTDFTLSTNGNAGTIGGTITGTIAAGTSTVTVTGVTLSTAGTGATVTATRSTGDNLIAGTSASFDVLEAASQLNFVGVPSSGNVGVDLGSFTVEALRPNNSLDNTFTGTITISKASGPGLLSGTVSVAAVAGVATFNAAQFNASGTYTLNANSGSLTQATSGNIVITLLPTVIAQFNFPASSSLVVSAKDANVAVTNMVLSTGTIETNITTGAYFPNEPYIEESAGWTSATQAGSKNFNFNITANIGYKIEVTSLQFNAYATTQGPSAFSFDLANGASIYTANAPDSSLLSVNQNVTGITEASAVPVLIQGWLNGSRTSAGSGVFRLDDVIVKGYVTCVEPITYTVTGGGVYCASGSGVPVGLSNSQVGVSYQLKLNGNNQGSALAGTGNILDFGLQTAAGTYTVEASNTHGSCNYVLGMTGSVAITIDAVSVGGSVTGSSAVCSGATSGLLTLSDHVGSVVRWESSVSPFMTWTPIVNTNTNYTSDALTQTTQFRAVVQSGSCAEAFSSAATVTIATTTWSSTNGGEWDNGSPTATTTAIISHNYTTAVGFSACALTVTNNANVIVSPNHIINLNGTLTVETGSTFTLESNAILLQGGTTNGNSGAISVKRNSSPLYRLDYTLWTSPVASQNLFGFSPQTLTNRFYTYKESTNVYSALDMYTNELALNSGSTFQTGRGYLIRTPNNWVDVSTGTPVSYPGSFTGVPNSGDIAIPINKTAGDPDTYGYNAVGNPYPSPISITTFLSDNSGLIGSTLWFWRKLNNINQTLPGQATTSYVTYSGGTFSSGAEAYYNIEPGQGFFVKANTAGSLQFKNTQREANNGRFFRTNSQTNTVGEGRLWLYLKNNDVEVGNLAIGYKDGATNNLDEIFDGAYINDSPLALTSLVDNKELSVQHRATPFTDTDVVPLSFKTDVAGTFSIVFNDADGELTTQEVYLEDLLLGLIVPIKTTAYSFSSNAGVFADRFRIVYVDNALGIVTPSFNANQIVIYKNGENDLIVNSGNTVMSEVKIFDIKGRLITERKGINASETTINVSLTNEVLLVQITSQEGVRVTKKVVK